MLCYVIKLIVSAGLITAITEIAKRNNYVVTIVHSLPLTSLLAFIWLYSEVAKKLFAVAGARF